MKSILKIVILFLVLISSCEVDKKEIKEEEVKYNKYDSIFEKVKKLSPVPIYFITNYDTDPNDGTTVGYFSYPDNISIYIETEIDIYQQICTTLHEINHVECYTRNCECYTSNDEVLCEEHSYEFVLTWLLMHQQKVLLKKEMESMRGRASYKKLKRHYKASKNIMKSRLWKTCEYFLENEK